MFPVSSRSGIGLLLVLVILLSACGGEAGDSWAGVKIDSEQNIVYMAFEDKVVAISAADGSRLWEYPPKDDRKARFYAIPTLDNGTLYIGDWNGRLHSINVADGSANWVYEPDKETIIGPISLKAADRVISGVALDSDRIFFGLGSENVVALSRDTAQEVWTFRTNHGVWGTPLYLPSDPNQENGSPVLYVVSLDHYLYAINPDDGSELWKRDLGGAAPGNIVYDAELNRLYVSTFASELITVDLATRRIAARYESEGWLWGGPALEVGEDGTRTLYLADVKGFVYAVQPTADEFVELWKKQIAEDAIRSTPLVIGDQLFVGSKDGYVYAINKTNGTGIWDDKIGGEVLSEFVSAPSDDANEDASSLVIVSSSSGDNRLVAFQSGTGERAWNYSD